MNTAKKPYTMPDGKTRSAGSGPWISREAVKEFLSFCESKGLKTREHPDLWTTGNYQVQFSGHWMSLLWNKSFKRFTVDRRLEQLVREFKAK